MLKGPAKLKGFFVNLIVNSRNCLKISFKVVYCLVVELIITRPVKFIMLFQSKKPEFHE